MTTSVISSRSKMTKEQAHRSYAIQSVLQKTDRILGQNVDVKFIDGGPAPAFTNGETIWISNGYEPMKTELVRSLTMKGVATVTGLNYHELAHCMFMPRLSTNLVQRVHDASAFHSFNILQDQSDETRFVHLYEPAANYFTLLVTDYMMENDLFLTSNYPLVAGRLFLPKKLRETFKARFIAPNLIDDIEAIVGEYKLLAYPREQERMYELIVDFQRLLDSMNKPVTSPNSAASHERIEKGDVDSELSEQLVKEMEQDDEPEDVPATAEEEHEEEGEDREGDQGAGQDELSNEEAPGEDGESSGVTDTNEGLESQLEEALQDAIEDLQSEIEERMESIKEEKKRYKVNADPVTSRQEAPDDRLIRTVEQCADEFRMQNEKGAPGWHTRQRQGKLNPRHYVRALKGDEQVFRRWDEGINDSMSFEVVFLLDLSSSMRSNGKITQASKSLWVLRRAFDELDGVTTIIGFESSSQLLSQRGERASASKVSIYPATGLTYVNEALKETETILSISSETMQLCIVITDGYFNDEYDATMTLERYPFKTAVIGINEDVERYEGLRSVIHTETITDPIELVGVVKNLALRLSNEHLARR